MKQSYFHGNSKKKKIANKYAYEAQRQKEIANKVEQATFDGVKYGLLAMEMMMIKLDPRNKDEISKSIKEMSPLLERYSKMITEQYIPLDEFATFLCTKHPELNVDELVEIEPKFGAYF